MAALIILLFVEERVMKSKSIRYWILIVILLVSALLSLAHRIFIHQQDVDLKIDLLTPYTIGGWEGDDGYISPGALKKLGTNNVLMRAYSKEGFESINLCITLGGVNHRSTHAAEVCYQGQGWEITDKETIELNINDSQITEALKFKVTDETSSKVVVVWYRTLGLETASFTSLKWKMLFSIFSGASWSSMVRLSCNCREGNEARCIESAREFIKELAPILRIIDRELEGR